MVNRREEIEAALIEAFSPEELQVFDESEHHVGHAGYPEGGQSHFRVRMRATALTGKTRVARHRAVHAALGAELIGAIHALALDLEAP